MSKIKTVRNFCFFKDLSTKGNWDSNLYLTFKPDEIAVRNISYSGPADQDGTYLLWCNLNGGCYIGTISIYADPDRGSAAVNVQSNILISCENLVPNIIQFQLHSFNNQSAVSVSNVLDGQLVIMMDFIQYK